MFADSTNATSDTEALREAFLKAFNSMGGAQALADWGQADPSKFYAALAKLFSGPQPPAPKVWGYVSATPYPSSDTPIDPEPPSQHAWAPSPQVW